MREKDVFSVFPRKLRSGKVVFYYQCYDENGNRSSGLSTGQVTKTAARVYCMRLYREGNLFPHKRHIPTFEEYAAPGGIGKLATISRTRKAARILPRLTPTTAARW
jgi:hypothetical protein